MIPYGTQDLSKDDLEAVIETLKSDFLTQGPKIQEFQNKINNYVGSRFSVAVNSATSALHISCLALGLKKGSVLWTSPISYVASSNCGLYCGAKIDFIDINKETFNICVQSLKKKLIEAKKNNNLPDIVIPVHFAGQPCEMEEIFELSKIYGFKVIEDASHAIGSSYKDSKTGNCKYSNITVFSFHPVKIITTGEGGIATTNDEDIARKLVLLSSHGVTRDPEFFEQSQAMPWEYNQIELGFNYRMTDIQASLGISQLKRINEMIKRRHSVFDIYGKELKNLPIILPVRQKDSFSSLHLYPIQIDPNKTKITRLEVFNKLRGKGIGVNVHYKPIHTQPYYQKLGFKNGDFPNAEKFYEYEISLPMHSKLNDYEQEFVIQTLKGILEN